MSDYNQSLSVPEARQRAQRLDAEGLYWIEEPTRAEDYAGHAQIRTTANSADPDWRELLGAERHGQGIGGRGV